MLAIVDCFHTWRHYFESATHQVTVYSDHRNLEYFNTAAQLNRRQARWAEFLSPFDFKIIYRKGSQNGKADALSRQSKYQLSREERQPVEHLFKPGQLQLDYEGVTYASISCFQIAALNRVSNLSADLLQEIREIANKDSEYQQILKALEDGAEGPLYK